MTEREMIARVLDELVALRDANLGAHLAAGKLSERLDGIVERLGEHFVHIDERLERIERAHHERLDEHSADIGTAVERIATIERGVLWTKAWAAGAGAASVALLTGLWWTVSQIPPGAWTALQRLGGQQ